jgi:uncharacterized protein involved in type VI secretion and phage assembly
MFNLNTTRLTISGINCQLLVSHFSSNLYGLHQIYRFHITCLSEKEIPFYGGAHVFLSYQYGEDDYYIHGIITDMLISHAINDRLQYKITLCSPLFFLTLSQNNRVFTEQTVIEVIRTVLKNCQTDFVVYDFDLEKIYSKQSLIIQYQETDFQFLMRLLNENQLWFYTEHKKTHVRWIFSDHFNRYATSQTLEFISLSDMLRSHSSIFDFKVHFNKAERIFFKTDHFGLQSGQMIIMINHPIRDFNRGYRIISISYQVHQNKNPQRQMYLSCQAIPVYQHFFVSSSLQSKHIIVPAKIQNGSQQDGYTVRFYFDTHQQNVNSIRCIQYYAGETQGQFYGTHFPLPSGTEIAVGFEEGCINRPIILGALSNPSTPNVVYCTNATHHRIRTHTSHEIYFDDAKDHEQIAVHTEREAQSLRLDANMQSPHVQLSNNQGDLHFSAIGNIRLICENDQLLKVNGHHKVQIRYQQEFITEQGGMLLNSGKNIDLKAKKGVRFQSLKGDLCADGNEIMLTGQKAIDLASKHHTLDIQSKSDMIIHSERLQILSTDQLKIGASITMNTGNLLLSQAVLDAPHITLQPSLPAELDQ